LRGVERPEEGVGLALPFAKSGMLSREGPAELRGEGRFFSDEVRGGEGARVVVEWEPLVRSLDMLVVVVDVLVTGATGGERGVNESDCEIGGDGEGSLGGGDCSTRIFRSCSTVRNGCGLSDVEESDCEGNSSIGGGMARGNILGEFEVGLIVDQEPERDRELGLQIGVGDLDGLVRLMKVWM